MIFMLFRPKYSPKYSPKKILAQVQDFKISI